MTSSWLKGEIVYQNKWSRVLKNIYKHKNEAKEIFTVDFGRRAAVILSKNKEILFVKQHRMLIDDYSLELPGGKVEKGESFEEGALRECSEETGIKCNSLFEIAFFHPGLETLNNPTKIFSSNDFIAINAPNISEVESVVWITELRVQEMLDANQFKDALTQIGLMFYFRKNKLNISYRHSDYSP